MANKGGIDAKIIRDSATGPGWRFVDSLDERFKKIKRMMVYIAAQELLTNVRDMIPKGDEFSALRDSLTLSEITGGTEAAFTVHASVKHRKVRKVDQRKTVLYVRAKRGLLNPTPEKIKFLEDNGPWTTDTIPFWPSKKMAVIVQRLVSAREAERISKMQQSKRQTIAAEMQRLGLKDTKKRLASQRMRKNKVVPDTSFAALNLEYGEPGRRPVPAWRVGIQNVMKTGIKAAPQKYRQLKNAFTKPDNKQWKRWPQVKDKVKVGVARGFTPFMKKLGFL